MEEVELCTAFPEVELVCVEDPEVEVVCVEDAEAEVVCAEYPEVLESFQGWGPRIATAAYFLDISSSFWIKAELLSSSLSSGKG